MTGFPLEILFLLRIYIHLQGSAFFSNASNKVNTSPAIHPTMFPSGSSIAIIGAGSVGSAIAQSLLLRRVVADLILVDIDNELCRAQVQDLCDTTHLHNVRIRQGSPVDAGRADITIITAGAKQRPTDTRHNAAASRKQITTNTRSVHPILKRRLIAGP